MRISPLRYNTGSNGLAVPNAMPDFLSRVAFNAGKTFHVDAGGVLRLFRHALNADDPTTSHAGGGVSVNARLAPAAATALLGQIAYGPGLGRYLGGLAPDVSISADGVIHPIRATSWVAGIEQGISSHASAALYDSGVRAGASYSLDADGSSIGFGYPGAPTLANKSIDEVTGVFTWQAWRIEGRGSMQWTTQASWLRRTPWSAGAGPASADAFMLLTQIRYNLP